MYTASTAFLEALNELGVTHIFANFGSDHPALVESLAEARSTGRPIPRVLTCPNEMVALGAAHGFAQATGRAQAVIVHVECGTQALAGAVHNAAKCRVPVLIFAGASPFTQEGEMRGSRNEFIHWLQDVRDQRGIVRGYMKYDVELRSGKNIKQMVYRAMQLASSDPQGPVYLMGPREVMEEETSPVTLDRAQWARIEPAALPPSAVAALAGDLLGARRPLVVTSYLGRNLAAIDELLRLCERAGVGVLESVPSYLNFPSDHPLYQGNQGNEPIQNPALEEADVVLVLDSDVPWIPLVNKPNGNAKTYHIDVDPLKEQMQLFHIPANHVYRADAATALRQINEFLDRTAIDAAAVQARKDHYRRRHDEYRQSILDKERLEGGFITPEYLTACVRKHIGRDTIVLNEGITNYKVINDHIGATRPGTLFTSGASSLGWNGAAAIGMKLAFPEKNVVCLTGDGSYMFSLPGTVHWMARQYRTPFLQIIYNNRGWRAPKFSTLAVHPSGYASKAAEIGVTFDPPPDYSGIAAAAGGALARIVRCPQELDAALTDALTAVQTEHRCSVLDVWLPHL